MTTDDKIRDEKLQYDISREAAKISELSLGKNWLIWIAYRWRNITFLPLFSFRKIFRKTNKNNWTQWKKQVES